MHSELDRRLSLGDLAKSSRLSRSRICFLFKSETGMAPGQYLKALRLERARELLETTNLSVKEIRARVGVRDQSHFARDFLRAYGVSPSQYRAQQGSAELDEGANEDRKELYTIRHKQ